MGATPPEDRIDFWREDPLLNEHHRHWHIVYNPAGTPSPTGILPLRNRHGELFAYMHQQMLARYDAERLAVVPSPGQQPVERVKPLADLGAAIPEGYDPGVWAWNSVQHLRFDARGAGATITDLAGIGTQKTYYERLRAAAKTGKFTIDDREERVTADNLGDTVEPNNNSIDPTPDNSSYGYFHNAGHGLLAFYDDRRPPPGVMSHPAAALRDPVFWRWHKYVDSLFREWQEGQRRHSNFSNGPPVKIRKTVDDGTVASSDIILCLKNGLPPGFDGAKIGTEAFGHSDDPGRNNWDKDFASATVTLTNGETVTTTDELRTEMRRRTLNLVHETGGPLPEQIDYLSHDDYFYFIRVENLSDQPQSVTARIFLAPETEAEDRTSWIEMDRFLYRLGGSERAVIFRPADVSSVIRKPALKPEDLESDEPWPTNGQDTWCDCGWPYTLLLPRGTKEGMDFRLFVMFSRGDDLMLPEQHAGPCTSVSYCGLQDKDYPDKQEMGYPFNRPFPDRFPSIVANHDNLAWRTIKIRCRNL